MRIQIFHLLPVAVACAPPQLAHHVHPEQKRNIRAAAVHSYQYTAVNSMTALMDGVLVFARFTRSVGLAVVWPRRGSDAGTRYAGFGPSQAFGYLSGHRSCKPTSKVRGQAEGRAVDRKTSILTAKSA